MQTHMGAKMPPGAELQSWRFVLNMTFFVIVPTGKTEAAKRHLDLRKFQSVLCATFRRTLAAKLAKDFGFVNYRELQNDKKSVFDVPYLVVQLDSLWRVLNRKYQLVILDELLSIILHSRSTLMQRPTEVLQKLLFFLLNADQVLMMDANLDERPAFDFIQMLARMVGSEPRWIYNTYVRDPRRTAHVYVCRSGQPEDERALQAAAMNKTVQLVQQGMNVYAPSTQKEHVETLALHVRTLVEGIQMFCTTSETQDADKDHFSNNVDDVLLAQRIWASSPTITAGISFEKPHFNRVVGYARNAGEHGATIDSFVQQLGRVRNLGDNGELHIYVCDPPSVRAKVGPVDSNSLDEYLQVCLFLFVFTIPNIVMHIWIVSSAGRWRCLRAWGGVH